MSQRHFASPWLFFMLAFSVTGCFVDTTGNARPDVPLSEGGVVDGSARVDSAVDAAVDAGMDADASCDDRDGDGVCDGDDGCPDDMDKTEPGMCGCGTPDTDRDSDGTADCNDMCPDDMGKTAPGMCGCGTPDTDRDSDGTADCNDMCPDDMGKTAPGMCGCGTPDTDSDGDSVADCIDMCDGGDDRVDDDGDGIPDDCDDCPIDGPTGFRPTFPVTEGSMSVTGVRWSTMERVPTIDAGSGLGLNIRYTVRDEPCRGCIKQIEVGFEGEAMFETCIYDGNPSMSGVMDESRLTVRFSGLASPGVYYLVANYAEQFSCGGSDMAWYLGAPGPSQRIAAVCVRAP